MEIYIGKREAAHTALDTAYKYQIEDRDSGKSRKACDEQGISLVPHIDLLYICSTEHQCAIDDHN